LSCASYPRLWQNLIEIHIQISVGGLLKKLGEIHSLRHKNYHDPIHRLFVVQF
jgi:hypothetical protein